MSVHKPASPMHGAQYTINSTKFISSKSSAKMYLQSCMKVSMMHIICKLRFMLVSFLLIVQLHQTHSLVVGHTQLDMLLCIHPLSEHQ